MILIVDDEKEIVEIMLDYFNSEGLKAAATTKPEVAIQMVAEGSFSCVITDIAMPVINGIELSKILKEHHPDVKIICVSGFAQMMLPDLEEAKIDSFLQKPFQPKELLECVINVRGTKSL